MAAVRRRGVFVNTAPDLRSISGAMPLPLPQRFCIVLPNQTVQLVSISKFLCFLATFS